MASKQKKGVKGSKKGEPSRAASGSSLIDTATGFLDVVEKTGETLAREVKQQFDNLAERVSTLAGAAGETSVAVAEKVTKEPVDALRGLLQDVKEVGETSVRTIGEGFDTLRQHFVSATEEAAEETGADKGKTKASPKEKASTKKKAIASKKKAATKKAASKKKVATKKAVSKKKAASKKKATKPKKMAAA